jgi:pyridoxamine 5'-phosphate oxidase
MLSEYCSFNMISEKTIDPSPFVQFGSWFRERLTTDIEIPDTVSLGTSSAEGKVSVRTVLLKGFNESGFVFFTNYNSKKGQQLSSNSRAALLFYWPESGRQVRIEGVANKVTEEESASYFKTRPRESQLASWASEQSTVIPDRQYLESRYGVFTEKFNSIPVEKPPHWGGFRLVPEWFEFWENGDFRLHDRLTYSKRKGLWVIERLAP